MRKLYKLTAGGNGLLEYDIETETWEPVEGLAFEVEDNLLTIHGQRALADRDGVWDVDPVLYHHPSLPIEAPGHYWRALGYETNANSGEAAKPYHWDDEVTRLLMRGLEATGASDHRVLVWAMTRQDRGRERREQTRAIDKLAAALIAAGEMETRVADQITGVLGGLSGENPAAPRVYRYESLGDTLAFAEDLGFVADDGDLTINDDDYSATVADGLEEAALGYIRARGYVVTGYDDDEEGGA